MKKPSYEKPIINMKKYKDFRVRISQVPPMDVAFQSMAMGEYELLVATIYRLNNLIEVTNNYTEKIDEVLEWLLNEGLELAVYEQLVIWKEDGTLGDLINEILFTSKLDKVTFEEFKLEYNDFVDTTNGNINDLLEDMNDFKTDINQGFSDFKSIIDQDFTNFKSDVGQDITDFKNDIDDDFTIFKTSINSELNPLKNRVTHVERITTPSHNLIYGNGVRNFMHRGLSKYFPENSYSAFDMAGFTGCKGLELDIWNSLDNDFICSHDNQLSSMTSSSKLITQTNSSEILNMNITKGNNADLTNDKMINFDKAIDVALRYNMTMIAEIKPKNLTNSQLEILIGKITSRNAESKIALMSFDFPTIQKIRNLNKNIVLGLVVSSGNFSEQKVIDLVNLKNSFLSLNYSNISEVISRQRICDNYNIPMTVWTVNSIPISQRLYFGGIRSITSDNIKGSAPTQMTKSFMLRKIDNVIEVDNRFMPEKAKVRIDGANSLELIYLVPMEINSDSASITRRSVASVSMSGSAQGDFYVRASAERNTSCFLSLHKHDGSRMPFSDLPNGSYFNVQILGYDFLNN